MKQVFDISSFNFDEFSSKDNALDFLCTILAYVEEGEKYNKPSRRGTSKTIKSIIEAIENKGAKHENA